MSPFSPPPMQLTHNAKTPRTPYFIGFQGVFIFMYLYQFCYDFVVQGKARLALFALRDDTGNQFSHGLRRIEFSCFLAGISSKLANKIFVSIAQGIRTILREVNIDTFKRLNLHSAQ